MRLRRLAVLGFIAVAVAAAGVLGWAAHWYRAPGSFTQPTTVVIERGQGLTAICKQLQAAGVLRHPLLFAGAAAATKRNGDLRAGEYLVPVAASPAGILALLRSGKTVIHRLVIPEGLSTAEVLAVLDKSVGLTGPISDPPAEGQLLPETYFYSWGDKRQALIDRMRLGMTKMLAELWFAREPDLPLTDPQQAVILASIVEKETGIDGERPKIAAVFYNRLRLGMRLQSDSTVAYGLTQGRHPLDHPLNHADLADASPYNTYLVTGLPPGPIANPGRAALAAVLHPADTDALYFVANGSGGHAFSNNLVDHNRNVTKLRQSGQR